MDYRIYRCTLLDYTICFVCGVCIAAVLSWLFYQSPYGMILFFLISILVYNRYKRSRERKRKAEMLYQFKDAMQAVSSSLLAGYSVENAWREAEKELIKLYGVNAILTKEFRQMNAEVKMNQSIEKLLADFAVRSGCEDIESFAEVFGFAKRSGGDFVKIIRTTIARIADKIEVEREIATVIAGKKMEGRIMNVMPLFILAYLNLTSKDFLAVLYGNISGCLIMSAAICVYAAAIKLSERIIDIEV